MRAGATSRWLTGESRFSRGLPICPLDSLWACSLLGESRTGKDRLAVDMLGTWRRRAGLAGAGVLALVLLGCDTFFEFRLVVTDCATGRPLQGAVATTHLDDGFGEEDHTAATDANGTVFIHLNEPDGVTVTLTIARTGYQTWTKQFRGTVEAVLRLP